MGDRMNLAGKDLVVNSVTEMRRRKSSDFQSVRNATSSAANSQAIEGLGYIVDDMGGTVTQVTASMSRIGARRNASSIFSLDVYAYNPRNSYSSDYASDYYVQTGYVSANGMALPVAINTRYVTFAIPATPGTWAIAVRKANALDEAYTPYVIFPAPDANNVMRWTDNAGQSFIPDANGGTWIIGSFLYDANNGLLNLFVQQEALSPSDFLKNRFMQIMNDADGTEDTDLSNWAAAMGVDQIFKRLAVLEAFISRLQVTNLTVGDPAGVGFCFQALSDDGNGNMVFDVSYTTQQYGKQHLFNVDVSTGKIYFGDNFYYDPTYDNHNGAIRSTGDNVVIKADGSLEVDSAVIKGNSMFRGDFNTPLISTTAERSSYTNYAVPYRSDYDILNYLQVYNFWQTLSSAGFSTDRYYRAEIYGISSSVRFIKITKDSTSAIYYYRYTLYFYDINMNSVNIAGILPVHRSGGSDVSSISYLRSRNSQDGVDASFWAVGGFTLRIYTGIDTITIDIPSESEISVAGITTHGTMYYTTDGTLKMKI